MAETDTITEEKKGKIKNIIYLLLIKSELLGILIGIYNSSLVF